MTTPPQSLTAVSKAYAASQQQSTSGGGSSDPPGFMGMTTTSAPKYGGQGHSGDREITGTIKTPKINSQSLSAVSSQYYTWDDKTKSAFLTKLNLAGYDTSNMSDSQMAQAWAAYAQQSASYFAQGVQLTPWDVMAKDMKQRESAPPKTTTSTTSNVQLSTFNDAHSLFTTAAQSLLGRDPTKAESRNFLATINAYEKEHPQVTTTNTTTQGGNIKNQTSTVSGGASAAAEQDIAQQQAEKDPEYGAYQAATTYFNALMGMAGKS